MIIGFIGLGHMGAPMAEQLLKAGYEVHVFDINAKSIQALVDKGAIATVVKELAAKADVIFTMVQTGQQVSELCLSEEGLFKQVKPHTLYIDCSSIDIVTTRLLHEKAKEHSIYMLDAPVSGGTVGAQNASLTFMVGGEEKDFQRALPFLQCMGKKIVYAGGSGSGQAAKICNNLLLGISMVGVSEAFLLAEKLGLAPQKFFEISSNASGQCWAMTSYCPFPGILPSVPSSHDYTPGFMAKMMLKDLHLGQHAAEAVQATIPLGALATELYELYVSQGFGETDFSGIINLLTNHQTSERKLS